MKRLVILSMLLLWTVSAAADDDPAHVVFLDSRPGVVNASTTYDPRMRTCGKGANTVYASLDAAAKAL